MKNYSLYLIIFILTVVTGCEKQLLETLPNDRLATELFWNTEQDGISAVNAAYPYLDGTNIFSWDGMTDIGHANAFFSNEALIEKGSYDALNGKIFTEYNNAYIGIAKSNNVLDNIDKVQTGNTTLINRLKAEARVLRAYQYIKLVGFFGDVPLVTKTIDINEGRSLTRTPANEIWDFVDKELEESAAFLPNTYAVADKGRITKGAALGLQARANLYAGRFQKAANAAKKVMDLNVYSLYPQYANLFRYVAENNAEVILDKQRIVDVASTNVFQYMAPYSQKNSQNSFVPTKNLADAFTMKNGKEITDPTSGFDPNNPYVNRDPRMRFSIYVPGDELPDGKIFNSAPNSGTADAVGGTMQATATGYVVKKYINKEDYATLNNSGINIILLRYAEVLLTYAEAKVELNQPDQSVTDAINLVRARSDVSLPALPSGLSQAQLRDAVRKERTVELAFEGWRMFDIRRWKTAENVIPGPVLGITYISNGNRETIKILAFEKTFNKNRDYLWPIPQKERELNPGLTQNAGW
jgi:hypothetical protein